MTSKRDQRPRSSTNRRMRFTLPILAAFLVADGALGFTAAPGVSPIRSFKPSLRTAAGPRDHLTGRYDPSCVVCGDSLRCASSAVPLLAPGLPVAPVLPSL